MARHCNYYYRGKSLPITVVSEELGYSKSYLSGLKLKNDWTDEDLQDFIDSINLSTAAHSFRLNGKHEEDAVISTALGHKSTWLAKLRKSVGDIYQIQEIINREERSRRVSRAFDVVLASIDEVYRFNNTTMLLEEISKRFGYQSSYLYRLKRSSRWSREELQRYIDEVVSCMNLVEFTLYGKRQSNAVISRKLERPVTWIYNLKANHLSSTEIQKHIDLVSKVV